MKVTLAVCQPASSPTTIGGIRRCIRTTQMPLRMVWTPALSPLLLFSCTHSPNFQLRASHLFGMSQPCFIEDLNVDILREIFTLLTLFDNAEFLSYPFHDPRQARAPLLLTYVCSHWRLVAIGTPSLWSSLRIDIENLLVPSGRQEIYRTWLDRAWGTPVSLEIIDIRKSRETLLGTSDWIGFLLRHIPYLRCLSTGPCVGNALIRGLLSKPTGSARHLEGLRISFPSHNPLERDCHGRLSALFPNLSQLYLSLSPSYEGFADLPINQLTHLSCDLVFFQAFLGGGRMDVTFSKLVELQLQFADFTWEMRPGHKQIIFPEIQSIQIHDTRADAILTRCFLSIIHCPRPTTLDILNGRIKSVPIPVSPPDSGNFNFFTEFLSHAPCLRSVVARHQYFLTTAFLNHQSTRTSMDYVCVSFPLTSTLYRTVADARRAFGEMWREHELEIAFLTGPEDTPHATFMAFVGWSRIPSRRVGRPYLKLRSPPFWDQGPYATYVSGIRDSRLVAC